MKSIDAIAQVCRSLSENIPDVAISTLRENYPFNPKPHSKAHCTPLESTLVFIHDGFIDRYSGEKLVFPPVLPLISSVLPKEFPFHPNWKSDVTHPAYWEVGATIDHLQPLALGGKHDKSNWLTTSMAHNFSKQTWTLEQLGWRLHDPGDIKQWDGLLGWFLEYTAAHPEALKIRTVKTWHSAAKQAKI
jgi:hypothetical protein